MELTTDNVSQILVLMERFKHFCCNSLSIYDMNFCLKLTMNLLECESILKIYVINCPVVRVLPVVCGSVLERI